MVVGCDDNLGDGWLDDGRPGLITVWIALTEATVDNGCMYILPTDLDPTVPDDLKAREIGRYTLPGIRAMPASPGSMFCWSTRLLHWGAKTSVPDASPRQREHFLEQQQGPSSGSFSGFRVYCSDLSLARSSATAHQKRLTNCAGSALNWAWRFSTQMICGTRTSRSISRRR